MRRADVVVVGGGAVGLASAWRLVQRGVSVILADPEPGSGASTVAAGMLAPVTEARVGDELLLALDMASWSRWPTFAEEVEAASGHRIGFRADGTVVAALDADDRVALRELVARQRSLGLEVTTLRGREARDLEPALAPGVRAAALATGEQSVDPEALVAALLGAADAVGVARCAERVAQIATAPGGDGGLHVTGVELEDGSSIQAPWVVLAAGCWSGQVKGLPAGAVPPVRPVKGQIATLRQPPGEMLLTRTVRGLVHGFSIYLVPRADGRVVCGATVEERGWDVTVTAGGTYELLREVLALVPGLDEAELVAVRSGLRPGTPDDLPIIGLSSVGGLVLATGHFRNGILLTPVTAEAVATCIAGGTLPPESGPCSPARFEARTGSPPPVRERSARLWAGYESGP
jgi:glycine oxidase